MPRRHPLSVFSKRPQRKRKTFSFERLEDRFAFSVATTAMNVVSFSNDTPEGALATWMRELEWAARQAANVNGAQPQYEFLALPSDPMFQNQWHLLNTGQEVGNPDLQDLFGAPGQDINVVPVWNMGYTGAGVNVAVFDSGLQLFHPDLAANIHPTLRLNATNGTTNASPNLSDPTGFHGTAVAGLIGAVTNNGIGGSGVAPGVTLIPIRRDFTNPLEETTAFQWAIENDIDITNNSWGPVHDFNRQAIPLTPDELQILRNSVIFGRDGLGMIHVFSSGNDGGPGFSPGFGTIGNYDSASYNPWVNSRYTIGVTGVDHDGLYLNPDDGTFTTYPTAGASVLVAAPTGSNGAITVATDDGFGSGIWTTDLVDDFGRNAVPDGFDGDGDFWPDADYTSRFNGTSASAPIVTGVIALMLEANPNLSYRDVQEILVRSSRQNAQFEFPASGGVSGGLVLIDPQNSWQTNQIGPFRNPDPWDPMGTISPAEYMINPLADPNAEGFSFGGELFATDTGDGGRQFLSHFEPQPALFTNGAGYTVSQGYGLYGEQIGYGHGVVNAELAVQMALQWHDLGQNLNPQTERTFTTSIVSPGQGFFWNIPAAEKGSDPPDGISFVVPGGIFGRIGGGFIDYWNEYFADDPFVDYDGPFHSARGDSYVDFAVPPPQAIDVEWVEVKLDIGGAPEDLDFLRIMLTSPDGTQSELNNYYLDVPFGPAFSVQPISSPPNRNDPVGDIHTTGGNFVWTFTSNRHWGESTNTAVVINPVTGEPVLEEDSQGNPAAPVFRNWELHIENWSESAFELQGIEVVWHGKPIAGGTTDPNWSAPSSQRVQGVIGIDTNADQQFNFNRYVQSVGDSDGDPDTIRLLDVTRQLDFDDNNHNGVFDADDTINQEPFAENIVVQAYRVFDGVAEATPIAEFLTGDDGNYYFDFNVQGDLDHANSISATSFEYEIRIVDPLDRALLEDTVTPSQYLQHYKQSWRVSPDWFFAPDRFNPLVATDNPGEIFFGLNDANGDGVMTEGPKPFLVVGDPVPMAVKNINFLLQQDSPPNAFLVTGAVYADLDGNGEFNGDDVTISGVFVYQDVNRNGNADAGEQRVMTDANGEYELTIPASMFGTFAVGVIPPTAQWIPTDTGGDGVENVFAGPGSPAQIVNFFLDPPNDAFPPGGANDPGSLLGVVFNDLNHNGQRNAGEAGIPNIRVFIDATADGVWNVDPATGQLEVSAITASNGAFIFTDVPPSLIRIDVHIENEDTANAQWNLTTPTLGHRELQLGPGGTVSNILFGLENLAGHDWGHLPDTFRTTAAENGPRHFVVPSFRLGSTVDGEVNGVSGGPDSGTDNGVVITSGGGLLQPGPNILQVTVGGIGGYLTGWIDWNKNGQFDEPTERLIWRDENGNVLGGDVILTPGPHDLQIIAPDTMSVGPLAARFRWGEAGLSFFGPAVIGEAEDYFLPTVDPIPSTVDDPGDYNNDNRVNAADFVLWRKYLNTSTSLPNDMSPGSVEPVDYSVWALNFGGSSAAAAASQARSDEATLFSDPLQPVALSVSVADSLSAEDAATAKRAIKASASAESFGFDLDSAARLSVATTGATPAADSAAASSVAQLDLLLLDQVWAELDDDGDEDAPLVDRFGEVGEVIGEAALAAVFENEANWWAM